MADWPDDNDDDVFEQLDGADTLEYGRPEDPLDEGYTAAERPWAAAGWGTTPREEEAGEGLGRRLGRELPDGRQDDGDGLGDSGDTDGELIDDEVGDLRAGRLVAGDGGDNELWATDIGVDGAGASAEEAAIHLVPESDER
ncbi:DUF5709 domain-containing protein [Amycolatopsis acidiphila]|uniref:DUF5709 domain-containing protein n=1 Tax=Amycolatopsis acidiphila TaxID=715473 RepID=A0A558ACU3_9PSEU|nr:DUF5709 domain-containing protein [Amycolatopsis acidiphila]TVT22013.1 hypothetical protein FNH06_14700 [Amycolatopsis acidiphila]UIJ63671.1 DUF5709 domain-containing protein [Amycolatopsis acidiphila]GHG67550.1 hypothetical protein GCM10017788_26510 [Amycolatopsis acidiphila]